VGRTSSLNRSRLVRYFGLKPLASSSSTSSRFRFRVGFISSAGLSCFSFARDGCSGLMLRKVAMVASRPALKAAKCAGSKSFFGWLKLSCNDQKVGYKASGSRGLSFCDLVSAVSTSILSPSAAAGGSWSKVVTFSTWYSPRRLTELLSPRGKAWNMKIKTRPQKAGSRARDRRRRSSLQVRRMTSCFCLKCFAVIRSRRDSRKSKTLRQPAMV